jgi:hypothetical protein
MTTRGDAELDDLWALRPHYLLAPYQVSCPETRVAGQLP